MPNVPKATRVMMLMVGFALSGCAGATPQSDAAQLESHWTELTVAIALAEQVDGVSSTVAARTIANEVQVKAELDACVAGTDTNCVGEVESSLTGVIGGLHLSAAATAKLDALVTVLPWLASVA